MFCVAENRIFGAILLRIWHFQVLQLQNVITLRCDFSFQKYLAGIIMNTCAFVLAQNAIASIFLRCATTALSRAPPQSRKRGTSRTCSFSVVFDSKSSCLRRIMRQNTLRTLVRGRFMHAHKCAVRSRVFRKIDFPSQKL